MRRALAVGMVPAALAYVGCGGSDSSSPSGSDQAQIRQVVERFNAAARGFDATILCGEVLPPSSLHGQSVEACAQKLGPTMQNNPGDWKPITDVSKIDVHGNGATATVTKAVGQPFTATFIREDGRWYLQVFD